MPHGPLADLTNLPAFPGVYIVYYWAEVLYVGKTRNLQRRWRRHHRRDQFASYGRNVALAWLPLPDSTPLTRATYENLLRATFKPQLNELPYPRNTRLACKRPSITHARVSVSNRIWEMRTQLKIDQKDFADALNVSRFTVWRWESGKLEPTIPQMIAIAQQLHTHPANVFPDVATHFAQVTAKEPARGQVWPEQVTPWQEEE